MKRTLPIVLLALLAAAPAWTQDDAVDTIDAVDIVRRAEDSLRGQTAQMKATMKIETPRWKRELRYRSWDDRGNDRSFTRILSPKKDRGTGFLRLGSTLWTYLPRVERTTRIPPSMMLQPWMGSDFTNDDLARESSLVDDYEASMLEGREFDGEPAWGVKLMPREQAPVVWSKLEIWLQRDSYAPLVFLYYDEPDPGRFELIRRLSFADIREVAGRPVPHYWKMEPLDKPGHSTTVTLEQIVLDAALDDALFTQEHLKRAEAVR
jgi:outer membrane lipoprotein-sorting protein